MNHLNVFRLMVIATVPLGVFSTSYAASTPIRSWPGDLCAVAKVSREHLPKLTHCARSIVVRTKEIGNTLVITFHTQQPAVIQLTRSQFYNQGGELMRDEPYYYPAVVPKFKDYKTRQSSKLMFASDNEVRVVFSISVRWLYQGGVEHRTQVYNRQHQQTKPSRPFIPTNPTLNPGSILHQTVPEKLKENVEQSQSAPAHSSLNEPSGSAVNQNQPAPAELVQVIPNIEASAPHVHPAVEPTSHEVRPPAQDHSNQSSNLVGTNASTNDMPYQDIVQVAQPVIPTSLTPPLNLPSIDRRPELSDDVKPAEPKTPKTVIDHPTRQGTAPQVISISPKRVGHQVFVHVKTDQPAAIILSAMSRCQGEACFGWQAMIAPPTDSSQLVTEIDLPLLDGNVLPVPSEIRLTVTTIDLAKRTANFSYRYDPATHRLTPSN